MRFDEYLVGNTERESYTFFSQAHQRQAVAVRKSNLRCYVGCLLILCPKQMEAKVELEGVKRPSDQSL